MLMEHFASLTDVRQAGKIKHNFLEIIVMIICAVIAGCEAWEDITDYCRVKQDWFRERLHMRLENGVPSHDTVQQVWRMIEPKEFEKCFRSWVSSIANATDGEIISIDGKTLRRSGNSEKQPFHIVKCKSACAGANQYG